jgi:hypothetical protein
MVRVRGCPVFNIPALRTWYGWLLYVAEQIWQFFATPVQEYANRSETQ